MHIGAVFPQTEIGTDPGAIRDYAQAVEAMGYEHILVYDHVLGADTAARPDWRGPYNSATQFHEPFVLFGYLAAITQRVELVAGVIILPQRQTALVAKQAAEADVLSGGRVRLGVGVGWNPVEYTALNEDFNNRGARSEEQIQVLRALWSAESITFAGRWHHIDAAGINPLPIRGAIPIWLGGSAEATLKRAGKMGDGWFPQRPPDEEARAMIERMHQYTREAGRLASAVGIEPRLSINQTSQESWVDYATAWEALGATHLTINTMGMGYATVAEHLTALQQVKTTLG